MAGWPALLLLLSVTVTGAADIISCDPNEYPYANFCCQRCQAGHHISRHCSRNHGVGECAPCEQNTFMAHASGKTECFPCVQCRDDQEIVAECTMTSDRRCQCKRGSFYCDSADCVENCFRCSRCPKNRVIRYPCNATADTVCGEANPEPGNSHFWSSVFVPFVVVFAIVFANLIYWKRKCLQRLFVKVFRRESVEPGSRSSTNSMLSDVLLPKDRPASALAIELPGNECLPFAPEPETCPGASENLESSGPAGLVAEESPAAPEQALHTPPAAHEPQGQMESAASLNDLAQEYAQKYVLKNMSSETINRCFYITISKVPKGNWKMFMRFIGLEENEIDVCEQENIGNVMEQCYKMLVKWNYKFGKDASIFKLMAALHKMELNMCLQNIINRLTAEGILGKHSEISN